MGEIFNQEIEKAKSLSYNKTKQTRILDDLGTAYLSTDFEGLDKSLLSVKMARKYLSSQGYTHAEIDDFFLQKSCLSKTSLRKLRNESIYNEDNSIRDVVSCIPFHTDMNTTDLIIEELKSRPALLQALKKGSSRDAIAKTFKLNNTTLLINFYNKYQNIIED